MCIEKIMEHAGLRCRPSGKNAWQISFPMYFPDGDGPVFYLAISSEKFFITDGAANLFHLSALHPDDDLDGMVKEVNRLSKTVKIIDGSIEAEGFIHEAPCVIWDVIKVIALLQLYTESKNGEA